MNGRILSLHSSFATTPPPVTTSHCPNSDFRASQSLFFFFEIIEKDEELLFSKIMLTNLQ